MRELALLFNFEDKSQINAVKQVFALAKVFVKIIPEERFGMTLEALVKNESDKTPEESQERKFDEQMIVFAGLTKRKLYMILDLLRNDSRCGKIPYKAVLTETNQKWDAFTLLEELKKEHAAMHGKTDKEQK